MKNCIYCKTKIADDFVVDVCKSCGLKVWGERMFNAIIKNMETARDAGDLFQGSVTKDISVNSAVNKNRMRY